MIDSGSDDRDGSLPESRLAWKRRHWPCRRQTPSEPDVPSGPPVASFGESGPMVQNTKQRDEENRNTKWGWAKSDCRNGPSRIAETRVRERRKTPAPTTSGGYRETVMETVRRQARRRQAARVAAPSTLAWLASMAPDALCECDKPVIVWFEDEPNRKSLYELSQRFVNMVRERQAEPLDGWLAEAKAHTFRALNTFADGLQEDYDAICAALSSAWSNGPVEGHVHRLKLIKRQMYGRANFDLLRARVIYAG